MSNVSNKQRVSLKIKKPNPLFEKWLTEWRNEAKNKHPKFEYTCNCALKAIKKYPLPLETGQDCIILKGFGKKLCQMLDKKLKEYKNTSKENYLLSNKLINVRKSTLRQTPKKIVKRKINTIKSTQSFENDDNVATETFEKSTDVPLSLELLNRSDNSETLQNIIVNDNDNNKTNVSCLNNDYTPNKNSPEYAILVSLMQYQDKCKSNGGLLESELVQFAQVFCNTSIAESSSYDNIQNGISTVISKGLVHQFGSPSRYNLTEDGLFLAMKLQRNDSLNVYNINSNIRSVNHDLNTVFLPYSFDVILLVDIHEITGGSRQSAECDVIKTLRKKNVNFEIRSLKVGDFLWIGRHRVTKEEIVFPYVIERKREDDLAHSIKDGRYHEQKFRLRQCGIRHLLYLIEKPGRKHVKLSIPDSNVKQASTNTLIQDKFQVKFSNNLIHSIKYIAGLTENIEKNFEDKTLVVYSKEQINRANYDNDYPVLSFKEFNAAAAKTKKYLVKELFLRQFLRVSGISIEKAMAIVSKYPSPKSLQRQYKNLNNLDGERLLSSITYGVLKKTIGPTISRLIYQSFTKE